MSPDSAGELFEQLTTGDGRRLLDSLAELPDDEVRSLRTASQLRTRYPAELVAAALTQAELRAAAAAKFARANQMYFTRDGLEQASSESVARYRATRYDSAGSIADLCCGIGGDLIALATGHPVMGVDLDPVHLRMAELNAHAYGVGSGVHVVRADVRDVDLTGAEAAFIDPARRVAGRRLARGASDPDLHWCVGVAERVPAVGIKAAPGVQHGVVPADWELEFIAVGRELKEAALWSPALAGTTRRATILPDGHTLVSSDGPAVPVRGAGNYLLDPNPAVTRAGLVGELARQLDAWKIDDQIAFLSADRPLNTPFGRSLAVLDSLPWREKDVRAALRRLDVGSVDIRRRGLAGDVDQIRRRLKLAGSRRAVLVMTRASDRPWCLVCIATDHRPPSGRP